MVDGLNLEESVYKVLKVRGQEHISVTKPALDSNKLKGLNQARVKKYIFASFVSDVLKNELEKFGRELKWNPHVNMLVTKGEIGEDLSWKRTKFFLYKMLRKRWQKILLDRIEESLDRAHSKKKSSPRRNSIMGKKNKKPKDKQRAKLKAKRELEKIANDSILYICSECGNAV